MHPQTFLNTFWRMELLPQVFVAMSFAPQYWSRFEQVISPSIREISVGGITLTPRRVDISKSGDSILTEISDGIAHARLVLADVSSIGKDSVTGLAYRNANVLYEVGLALACRHHSEVLLVRDDHDDFLFDVSTVPHKIINFADEKAAKTILTEELRGRLQEQNFHHDARVSLAIASLSAEEVLLFHQMKEYTADMVWAREVKGIANWYSDAIHRMLDKELICLAGEFSQEKPAFKFTPLGWVVHQRVNGGLQKFEAVALQKGETKDDKVQS
ncbi:MAG: hypothetical protein PHE84_04075 [bacterium]|nr:hypothetical protein [bacterium]